jgi:hypothetical protein
MIIVIGTTLLLLVFGIICSVIAGRKDKNTTAWFIWGIAFGAHALGYLLLDVEE